MDASLNEVTIELCTRQAIRQRDSQWLLCVVIALAFLVLGIGIGEIEGRAKADTAKQNLQWFVDRNYALTNELHVCRTERDQ